MLVTHTVERLGKTANQKVVIFQTIQSRFFYFNHERNDTTTGSNVKNLTFNDNRYHIKFMLNFKHIFILNAKCYKIHKQNISLAVTLCP